MEGKHTIQEIADRYGISYQAVAQRISKENLKVIDINGKKFLPEESYEVLIKYYDKRKNENTQIIFLEKSNDDNEDLDGLQSFSKEEVKNKLLQMKINELTKELDKANESTKLWQQMYMSKDKELTNICLDNVKKLYDSNLGKKKKTPFWKRKKGKREAS